MRARTWLASLLLWGCNDASEPATPVGTSTTGTTTSAEDPSTGQPPAGSSSGMHETSVGDSSSTGEPRPPAELEPGELRPGGDTTVDEFGIGAFVQEAANLRLEHRSPFEAGLQFFQLAWLVAPSTPELDGLGPTFNAPSCLACHIRNGRAPAAIDEPGSPSVLIRLTDLEGAPDPVLGGQLQPFAIPGVPSEGTVDWTETVLETLEVDGGTIELAALSPQVTPGPLGAPSPDTLASPRLSMQLVGMGLLEAIAPEDLEAWADPDDADRDGISGRVAYLPGGEVGRFGWKSGQPTVRGQVAAAFLGDLGITSVLQPQENCPAPQSACAASPNGGAPELTDVRLDVTATYVRLLGVPARRDGDHPEVLIGKAVFADVGCDRCHRPSFVTEDVLEEELRGQTIWPYTDLLLHDMGPTLAQGGAEGAASAAEWRTPPLWSLGLVDIVNGNRRLLHDGRARTLAEAIAWHGGEALAARDAYLALAADEREALHAFVESL